MYTYSVFCIRSEIVTHYYYKTGILYRFLKEFKENRKPSYLQLQYNFITEPLTLDLISSSLQYTNEGIDWDKRDNYLKMYRNNGHLSIYKDERHLEFSCDSIEEAEEFLFPMLRRLPLHFFVVNNTIKDYGWLTLDKNNYLEIKQILYS
ncbi:sporulation inhibitor of replication protein SirA [Oceanobacillus sp. CAU 1775]